MICFAKVHTGCLDEMRGFFKKLTEKVGHVRVEAQSLDDMYQGVVTLSFDTDLEFNERESKQVDIVCSTLENGDWQIDKIEKL